MTAERWQQVKEIFHAALLQQPEQRSAFVSSACAGDELLRQEVESLIFSHEKEGSFIDSPAYKAAANLLNGVHELKVGQTIGSYEIISFIGRGGMGEVYLAEDKRLSRKVALKMLPASFTEDSDRLGRFEQEARTASALNHPNIITIYEILKTKSTRLIATEFVEGETLRHHLSHTAPSISESLRVAIQIADALAAAHKAGIIHRDIKPENIMLRPDGYVKVLDFGLAKLIEVGPSTSAEAPTKQVRTGSGMIMGTVGYMSPEQARGKSVDARSDIFSLGAVVYEMITRHQPFEGETPSDVLAAVLKTEPPPLAQFTSEAPVELSRIVSKALCKELNERYQTVEDLLLDLKSLRRDLDLQSELGQSPSLNTVTADTARNDRSSKAAARVEYLTRSQKLRRRGVIFTVCTLLAVLSIGAVSWWKSRTKVVSAPPSEIKSLAVLPFKSLGPQNGEDYLGVGLADVTITRLGSLDQLVVRPLQSVLSFAAQDPLQAGQTLKVDAVLDGSVQQSGNRVRVTLRLLRVADGKPLWTGQIDERGTDIFALQDAISQKVTEVLALQLNSAQQQLLAKHYTDNAEAYRAYLKGRYYRNRFTREGFKQAIDSFQQAISLDPKYALAYAGLADTYYWSAYFILPAPEAMTKAKEAAQHALALDENLAEAHLSLGQIRYLYDWQFVEAEQHFKRALALNPGLAEAHLWYGQYLALMGRFDDGLAEIKRAEQINPLSPLTTTTIGLPHWLAGRPDEAIAANLKAIELNPSVPFIHLNLGITYASKGEGAKGVAEFQRVLELGGNDPDNYVFLAYGYARSGNRAAAEQTLKQALSLPQATSISPYTVASVYIALGDHEQAFAWLEKAFAERSEFMVWLKTDPRLDPLRSDPRFADLLRRVGLPA